MALTSVVQTPGPVARDEVRRLANTLAMLQANDSLTAAGCATATTTSKVKTVNTLTFKIDGVFKTKAATDNFWTLSGSTVADLSWQKYLLLIDASGAASVRQGTPSLVSAAAVVLPDHPGSVCIAGVLTVATSGSTFIPGTTLLGAVGITATYVDGADASMIHPVSL